MQLLPWVIFFALRLERPFAFFGLSSLMALFVLDGGIYTAIFSVMLLLAGGATGLFNFSALAKGSGRRRTLNLLTAASLLGLIGIKVVPVLLLTSGIEVKTEFSNLGFIDLARAFFNPFQRHLDVGWTEGTWRFHEIGCYLSPIGVGLILLRLRALASDRFNKECLFLLVLFFWIGSGLGGPFNPWHLYQRIPLFNVAHVQSRLFIVMDLFFAILVAAALDSFRKKQVIWFGLLSILALEATFEKNYPFHFGYQFEKPVPEIAIIPDVGIRVVHAWGIKPDVYFSGSDSFLHTYETSAPATNVVSDVEPNYRGLAYVVRGEGKVSLKNYGPATIELDYSAGSPLGVEINSNYLGGWISDSKTTRVYRSPSGLIDLDLKEGEGTVRLSYRPSYLKYVLPLYVLGALLWFGLLGFFLRHEDAA
jgi:hypothetical protein